MTKPSATTKTEQDLIAEIKTALKTNKDVQLQELLAILKSKGFIDLTTGNLDKEIAKIRAQEQITETEKTSGVKATEKSKAPGDDREKSPNRIIASNTGNNNTTGKERTNPIASIVRNGTTTNDGGHSHDGAQR